MYPDIKKDAYQISNFGRVRTKLEKRIKKQCLSEKGYLRCAFVDDNGNQSTKKIHRIVAVHFVPNDDPLHKVEVDHKDCNKLNNHDYNLEWVTHAENIERCKNNGLLRPPKGINHYRTYLTLEQVEYICQLLAEERSYSKVYRKIESEKTFYVTIFTVWNIWKKRTWKDISDKYF